MSLSETALIRATPLHEHGHQGEVNWISETNDARTTLSVLAQNGLLNQFDHFKTEYVGSRFDALTGAFVRGKSDINGLEDLIESIAFCLFMSTQIITQADWQSVYTFDEEALVRTDSTESLGEEQRTKQSHTLLISDASTRTTECAVLFHVTPLGAVWLTVDSSASERTVKSALEGLRQVIARSHREQQQQKDTGRTGETSRTGRHTTSSISPSTPLVSRKTMAQLIIASKECDDRYHVSTNVASDT